MGVEVTCDKCDRACDDVFCENCSRPQRAPQAVRDDDVIDLATAIRCGNMAAALESLERVAREIEGWPDLIAPGRYSSVGLAFAA